MSKNGVNRVAIAAALAAKSWMVPSELVFSANGNPYPVNNKKGFAARDKRRKKK